MINSGYILPNFEEVVCGKFEKLSHNFIANFYLEQLKLIDIFSYRNLENRRITFALKTHITNLEDFFIFSLGWIKIGNYPQKYIVAADFYFQDEIIREYLNAGYQKYNYSIIQKRFFFEPIYFEKSINQLLKENNYIN